MRSWPLCWTLQNISEWSRCVFQWTNGDQPPLYWKWLNQLDGVSNSIAKTSFYTFTLFVRNIFCNWGDSNYMLSFGHTVHMHALQAVSSCSGQQGQIFPHWYHAYSYVSQDWSRLMLEYNVLCCHFSLLIFHFLNEVFVNAHCLRGYGGKGMFVLQFFSLYVPVLSMLFHSRLEGWRGCCSFCQQSQIGNCRTRRPSRPVMVRIQLPVYRSDKIKIWHKTRKGQAYCEFNAKITFTVLIRMWTVAILKSHA